LTTTSFLPPSHTATRPARSHPPHPHPPARLPAAGIYRSGFVVAAYLAYTGAVKSLEEGLVAFAAKRFPPAPAASVVAPAVGNDDGGEAYGGEEEYDGGGGEAAGGGGAGVPTTATAGAAAGAGAGVSGGGLMTTAPGTFTAEALAAGGGLVARLYPSWRYLGRHVEAALRAPATIPRVHRLSYVIAALPGLPRHEGDHPVLQLYQASERECGACG
jgi:hypothetical protein